jgi:selenocysteine lyase/cysteine desulfurase
VDSGAQSRCFVVTIVKPAYDIEHWRRRIPLLRTHIPMNNCSQAPQMGATRVAAERYLESWNGSGMDWDAWMSEVALAKAEFAKLIGARASDVAVFSSVSEAASAVASALDLPGSRRKIIVSEAEFPTIAHVWLAQERRGARVTWAPVRDDVVDESAYDALIDDRAALVSACHGYYMNGALQDSARIATLARRAGAYTFVDAYQSLGTIPVDVRQLGVDFLASGNLKFLMGIPGIAFLYVRPEIVETLRPMVTGWFGRANPFAFNAKSLDWSPTASRFDTGTPPVINAYVARAGMEIINTVGPANIRAWLVEVGQHLIDGGRARGLTLHGPPDMNRKTSTAAFVVDDSHHVESAMRERGVIASARGAVIRLAPHFYSTIDDVDRALDILADVVRAT